MFLIMKSLKKVDIFFVSNFDKMKQIKTYRGILFNKISIKSIYFINVKMNFLKRYKKCEL